MYENGMSEQPNTATGLRLGADLHETRDASPVEMELNELMEILNVQFKGIEELQKRLAPVSLNNPKPSSDEKQCSTGRCPLADRIDTASRFARENARLITDILEDLHI